MIRINLAASDRPSKKRKSGGGGGGGSAAPSTPGAMQAYLLLGIFLGGALLVCLGLYFYVSGQIRALDTRIAAAQQRQRELQEIKRQVDALELKRATFQRKVDLIERLKAEQRGPVHMLDEVSKALPDYVWLTHMDQTGAAVKFTGQSNGLTSVADFISALERSGWFPTVDLASSTETNNVITYGLTANFVNPEVAKKEAEAAARRPLPGSTAAAKPAAAPKR
jgi:type IV pilus assembly protein PilN